ncbi:hypothetical protein TNCV_186211 [Trichonephila clavipes]|nr:hypothetical protein TNCV_186211 [Trichonephila clavipes]
MLYLRFHPRYLTMVQNDEVRHQKPSTPTEDVISRVFSESSASEQVVAIHSGMAAEWAGLVRSPAKPVEGHGSIFVNVCGDDALCSSEGQGNFQLSRLGSLLDFLVGSFIFGDPNTTWDPLTATAGSNGVQSGRPIFDDFFQHLWPYIGHNTANVVFQMVKRLWLIRIDQ